MKAFHESFFPANFGYMCLMLNQSTGSYLAQVFITYIPIARSLPLSDQSRQETL